MATGHYARRGTGADGRALLRKGRSANDQSYMLARLPQEILSRTVFPLGELEKAQVRALAQGYGIPVADKPDSMEICFIPDGDYAAWLDQRGKDPAPPGDFVDPGGPGAGPAQGNIHHYTLGQRRGLGASGPHRYSVSAIRPECNEVVLSDGSDLYADSARCAERTGIALPGLDGERKWTRARATPGPRRRRCWSLRTRGGVAPALPRPGPHAGPAAVFYDGETVLGSGWIIPEGLTPYPVPCYTKSNRNRRDLA